VIIKRNVTIYKCEHCGKRYVREYYAAQHESMCRKRPENSIACFEGCKFLEKKTVTLWKQDCNGYGQSTNTDILYCKKKKCGVYPYWIKGYDGADLRDKGSDEDMLNIRAPHECKSYDTWN